MMDVMRRPQLVAMTLLGGALLVGCSSSTLVSQGSAISETTLVSSTTAVVTSTSISSTTSTPLTTSTLPASSTTTEGISTTSVPGAAQLLLQPNGLGLRSFGDDIGTVIEMLSIEMGGPTSVNEFALTVVLGPNQFESADGEMGFVSPFAKVFCYQEMLCATFGGDDPVNLTFVGWTYRGATDPLLRTIGGVTYGSRWSDVLDLMTAEAGGCYSSGSGATNDGVALQLSSPDELFAYFDDAGNYVAQIPSPENVTVESLFAGEEMQLLFGDC